MYKSFLSSGTISSDYFSGTDTEELFNKNKKKQTDNWIYHTKHIEYKNNESGFRTRPFNKINWKEVVVVFGCSFIYGVGLAEEDTICYILEKKLGRPVINLGIGGSAIDINHYNSMILHENFPRPKAIVHCWTSLDRYTDFRNVHKISYIPTYNNYYLHINWAEKSKMYVFSDRIVWRNKVIYKEYSFFEKTCRELDVPFINVTDNARDLSHPGIETNLAAANTIFQDLKKQGI